MGRLSRMYQDRVKLVKANGKVGHPSLAAIVMQGKIQLDDGTALIEAGDHLLRTLPNGLVEDYTVIDPILHSALGVQYYEVIVQKGSAPAKPEQATIQHITNVFHGDNSRANFNSTDNSVNVSSVVDIEKIRDFAAQIRALRSSLPAQVQEQIISPLADLESAIHGQTPNPSRIADAVRSIRTIAEGAAGNLIASGIVSMSATILSSIS